jgi:hypothetical protein
MIQYYLDLEKQVKLRTHELKAALVKAEVAVKVKAKTQELEETISALEQKVRNRTIELERLIGEPNKSQGVVDNSKIEM